MIWKNTYMVWKKKEMLRSNAAIFITISNNFLITMMYLTVIVRMLRVWILSRQVPPDKFIKYQNQL
jgi:hypothetical protein